MGLVSRDTGDEDPGTKNQITVVVNDQKSQIVTKREEKSHEKTSQKNGWPKKKEIITIEENSD